LSNTKQTATTDALSERELEESRLIARCKPCVKGLLRSTCGRLTIVVTALSEQILTLSHAVTARDILAIFADV